MSKSYRTITETRHQEDKQNKATSSLFSTKILAKLEKIQSSAQQNMEQTQKPTMESTTTTKTESLPKNGQQPMPLGAEMHFTGIKSSP